MQAVRDMKTRFGRLRGLALISTLIAHLGACVGGDSLTNPPPRKSDARIPWELNPAYRAINLVVGESVQLSIDPRDFDGNPIPVDKLPPVEYQTTDTAAIQIDENGVLTAKAAKSTTINITAVMQDLVNNWTRKEQIQVRVVNPQDAYPIAGLKLEAIGTGFDLAETNGYQPANRTVRFLGRALDAAGNVILAANGNPIEPLIHRRTDAHRSEYSLNASTGTGTATNKLANPTVIGSAYIFGKYYEDTVSVKVTYPDSAVLYLVRQSNALNPSPTVMPITDLTILKGGKINFRQSNSTSPGDDIVFDDLTKVVNGNIPVVSNASSGANATTVTFPNTGVFTYQSNSMGITGKITVVDWPTD